jgi:FkbM family methyltransferase
MDGHSIIEKELEEKKLVREFFNNKNGGFYIKFGANEPDPLYSQSLHLEEKLKWRGLLIEPIDYLAKKLRDSRPGSTVIEAACTSNEKVGKCFLSIPISKDGDISGQASLETNIDHSLLLETRKLQISARTLDSIIKEFADGVQIDILSIDVEGTELDVLKGANLKKKSPKLLLIEDRLFFLGKHLYLKKLGYKIFRRTGFNNWFTKHPTSSHTSLRNQLNLLRKIYLSSWIKRIRESFRMKTFETFLQL